MQVIILLPVTLLAIVMVLVDSKHYLKEEDRDIQDYKSENQGSGRVISWDEDIKATNTTRKTNPKLELPNC